MARVAAATLVTALAVTAPSSVFGDSAPRTETMMHNLDLLPGLQRHPELRPYVAYVPPMPHIASPPATINAAPIPIPFSSGVDNLTNASAPIQAFAACVRQHENGWAGYAWGYPAGTGDGGGAYQFMPETWATANGLYGGNIDDISAANQDNAFVALFDAEGTSPWAGDGCVQ